MIQKIKDLVYNIIYFFLHNKWAFGILIIIISILISVFFLYPINPSLAYGFTSGVVLSSIYKFLKFNSNE